MKMKRAFDFLYYQLEKYPRADCMNFKENGTWRNHSTAEIVETVNKLSLAFLEMGYKAGDKMAIISANRPEWALVDLAMQQVGITSVPMYPTITVEDYKYIFGHSEVKMVFVGDKGIYGKVQEARTEATGIDEVYSFDQINGCKNFKEILENAPDKDIATLDSHKEAVKEDDLLTIIYTSGTTGRPKGVMLSHKNIVSNAFGACANIPLELGKDKALSFLPMCHVYERTGTYVYFYMGIGIYFAESIEKISDNLKEISPHTFNTVPRLLEKVFDKIVAKGNELTGMKKKLFFWALELGFKYEPTEDQGFVYNTQLGIANSLIFSKWREALGGNIKMITCGSAALQLRLKRVFWAAEIKVLEGYGLTETAPIITASIPTHEGIRFKSVGKIMDGVEVKIAEDGEILAKGPNVMMGYYKDADKTAEVMTGDWFHTGDIGEIFEDNYLRITDRKKEMFKTSGGKYVAPQLIENKFKESNLIEQIMVVGESQKFPGALIVPAFEGVKEWCKNCGETYTSESEMCDNPKLIAQITKDVAEFNQDFGNWEQIKKFKLLPTVWGIETGELTPTLKLKRRIILEKYNKEIDGLYEKKY